jgi:hypothetical protein
MKALLAALALAGLTSVAQAETIALQPSGCAMTRICLNVINDAVVGFDDAGNPVTRSIQLYAYPQRPNVWLIIDGEEYSSPYGNDNPIQTLALYTADGRLALLDAEFTSRRVCGIRCVTIWTLVNGQIVR